MVSQKELILRVITLWFLVLSQFFRDGMGPFNLCSSSVDLYFDLCCSLLSRCRPLISVFKEAGTFNYCYSANVVKVVIFTF